MTVDEAYDCVAAALDAGRAAHGYLVVGQVRGMAGALADRVLARLFGAGDLAAHPDVHRLAPEMKSRVIGVEAMHARIIDPMGQTAFQGGWKAGVIQHADRLNAVSANAFLKVLEEPPPQTLFLLLTEQPEQLLPTIISRCQRIDLPDARTRTLAEPYRTRVLDILARPSFATRLARNAAAGELAAILAELKDKAEAEVGEDVDAADDGAGEETGKEARAALVSARYREYRTDFTATLMSWFRDLMALVAVPPSTSSYDAGGAEAPLLNEPRRGVLETRAAQISRTSAFHNVESVEEFAASLEHNMQELPVLALLMDRVATGADRA